MTWVQAFILGIVQGSTEFLPVSSSGHLVLFDHLLHVPGDALALDVFLHAGTLLAVLISFREDIVTLFQQQNRRLLKLLLVSTIPTVAIGLLFQKTFAAIFHSGATLGLEFVITGTLLLYTENQTKTSARRPIETLRYRGAFFIGCAQGAAIMPALSRSGLTLCAALGLGIEREAAVKFSFLLSIPVIVGATFLELPQLLHNTGGSSADALWISFAASAISGYLAIRFMIKWIQSHTLRPFGFYALLLGLLLIVDQLFVHLI